MHHPLYRTACEYKGSPVEIRDCYGESYRGTIEDVTENGVYIDTGSDPIFFPFLTIASLVLLGSLFF
ncbi:hypothetical protein ACFSKI_00385 [Pseudogracilibacillus auburnensis]|uniref:Uncharacterized protein n=1 Tax=Pseudogracilibacillus auburnensis TaxID=1494959 RepID=A0A2V3VKK2_9BACI|nr:hypothetical protein [Pseudogracilibacillus auburnensis]MBO1004991.1 hypothetical protein [Pseudogracilibacillus auburnensis]PXW81441.1 hypothetical protein DFR56_12251 [Pseudogracilibacillus auburnensis]